MQKMNVGEKQAKEMLRDTLKFLSLCARSAEPLAPPKVIDEVWHLFILSTVAYSAFCREYLGVFIHHNPAVNGVIPGLDVELETLHYRTLAKAQKINEELNEGPLSNNFLSGIDVFDWCCHGSSTINEDITEEVEVVST